jgi:predicted glycogen debranching enzyme
MPATEAQQILKTFLQYEKNGLIPNRFPDDAHDKIEYNTADASLWLFVTLWELQKSHKDDHFIALIFPSLTRILTAHLEGTDFNIKVLDSGLLSAGETPWQLTWMDAKMGDHTFTPREGCPVEINALWYNALKIYQQFQKSLKDKTLDISAYIKTFENNFTKTLRIINYKRIIRCLEM